MSRRRRLLGLYARIGRVYRAWSFPLLVLATLVFIPIGLVDALLHSINAGALNLDEHFKFAAFVSAAAALTASGLFGEVFFSGAVAISLTHPEHEHPPGLRQIARQISYRKLILVDIFYVLVVDIGAVALILPGLALFVYLSLSGPVVELEKHTVGGGFARSFRLVRGHFWMVAAVVIPIEIVGDVVDDALVGVAHHELGHGLVATWIAESASNIATAPFFAIAVVLLALDLVHHVDGTGPILKRRPAPILAAPDPDPA